LCSGVHAATIDLSSTRKVTEVRVFAVVAVVAYALVVGVSGAGAQGSFANCTAMHVKYRHGIGKVGAHDHTSGVPVTNFYRSNRLYYLNRGLDRDKDGIACEKR
jgi:Excalibur calcium-binding domain